MLLRAVGVGCRVLERSSNHAVPLIAIIDDQHAAVDALAELIPLATGYRTVPFTSGRAFLSWLDEELPDAVVLDLRMPDPDGMTILNELQRRGLQRVPVIVMTASGESAIQAALAAGATAGLQKPLHLEDLVVRLREVLKQG